MYIHVQLYIDDQRMYVHVQLYIDDQRMYIHVQLYIDVHVHVQLYIDDQRMYTCTHSTVLALAKDKNNSWRADTVCA